MVQVELSSHDPETCPGLQRRNRINMISYLTRRLLKRRMLTIKCFFRSIESTDQRQKTVEYELCCGIRKACILNAFVMKPLECWYVTAQKTDVIAVRLEYPWSHDTQSMAIRPKFYM